ncbi:MAG: RNA 2',3'-cyclic phosphodiesterase [Planctomycetota bacterium]
MRLFAAIDIAPQIQEKIGLIQQQLKRDLPGSGHGIKWVRPKQVHLTLKFLGEVRDSAVTQVCDVLTRTVGRFDSFDMHIRGLGVFGQPARVLWAGVEPCPALVKLQAELESGFETIGWKKEDRAFAGHLTLCRIKSASAGKKLAQAIETRGDEVFGSVWVKEAVLYESRLTADGPQYGAVCTAPLK